VRAGIRCFVEFIQDPTGNNSTKGTTLLLCSPQHGAASCKVMHPFSACNHFLISFCACVPRRLW
jgi:hypothetical protein